MLNKLRNAQGDAFDKAYLAAQLAAHRSRFSFPQFIQEQPDGLVTHNMREAEVRAYLLHLRDEPDFIGHVGTARNPIDPCPHVLARGKRSALRSEELAVPLGS